MTYRGAEVGDNEVPTSSVIGERIRSLRHKRRISQEALSVRMGAHNGAAVISRIELGKELPSLEWCGRCAGALGFTDLGKFFSGINPADVERV